MIAYNYCFTTCLGSLKEKFVGGRKTVGVREDYLPPFKEIYKSLNGKSLDKYFHISPNNVIWLKKNVREGLIPKLLFEFL